MGDNVDSDLLYDDFQNEEQKEFNNVSKIDFHYLALKKMLYFDK